MEADTPSLPRATQLAHQLIRERVEAGDTVVDATVGNGHDTLFLAKQVGESGRVTGFDIQGDAIESTRSKAKEAGFENITLIHGGHETMAGHVDLEIAAAMFNLGYLPGGDKTLITQSDSTIEGLEAACKLGAKIITVVVYSGHTGGDEEAKAVTKWAGQLDQTRFTAAKYEFLNQRNTPPFLIVIERK